MKSYTDLEQSKKLAEILPLESADQTWEGDGSLIPYSILNMSKEPQYKHQGDTPFKFYSGLGLPCWSLAALLNILPKSLIYTPNQALDGYCCKNITHDLETYGDNPVDACVAMVEKLHELNLL